MANIKPVFVGTEDIMRFYDSVNPDGVFAYSLFFGDQCMLQYPGNGNEDKARDFLETCLKMYDANEWDKVLWLKLHEPQSKLITRKTDSFLQQPVGFIKDAEDSAVGGTMVAQTKNLGMNMEMFRAIQSIENLPDTITKAIDAKMQAVEERMKALEQPLAEEITTIGQISGLLDKHPQLAEAATPVMQVVAAGLQQFIAKLLNTPQTAPLGINGAPQAMTEQNEQQQPQAGEEHVVDNDKLEAALDRLNNVMILDDDLTLLANAADKNPAMFAQFLTFIRTQG